MLQRNSRRQYTVITSKVLRSAKDCVGRMRIALPVLTIGTASCDTVVGYVEVRAVEELDSHSLGTCFSLLSLAASCLVLQPWASTLA